MNIILGKDVPLKITYGISVLNGILILSVTLVLALFVEEIVGMHSTYNWQPDPSPMMPVYRYIIVFIAVLELALISLVRRGLLSRKLNTFLKHNKITCGNAGPFDYAQYTLAYLIIFTLCISVCFYGLILFIMSENRMDFYLLMALSIAGFAMYFPRYSKLRAWAGVIGMPVK